MLHTLFICFFKSFFCYFRIDNEQHVDPRLLFKWKRLLPVKFTGMKDVQDEQDEKIFLQTQVILVGSSGDIEQSMEA